MSGENIHKLDTPLSLLLGHVKNPSTISEIALHYGMSCIQLGHHKQHGQGWHRASVDVKAFGHCSSFLSMPRFISTFVLDSILLVMSLFLGSFAGPCVCFTSCLPALPFVSF